MTNATDSQNDGALDVDQIAALLDSPEIEHS
jgi:hypothetical protein